MSMKTVNKQGFSAFGLRASRYGITGKGHQEISKEIFEDHIFFNPRSIY